MVQRKDGDLMDVSKVILSLSTFDMGILFLLIKFQF